MPVPLIDLSFRNLTPGQAVCLLELADNLGASPAAVTEAAPATPVPSAGSPSPTSSPSAPPSVSASSATSSPSATSTAASGPPPAASREPGEDDGPPMSAEEEAYFRCTTFRSVVKRIVEDEKLTKEADVVARVLALKARGLPVLEAVPDESIPDRVAPSLAALGL